jgi:FkbM family methyltransferase
VGVTTTLFDGQSLRVVLPEVVASDLFRRGWIEPDVTTMLADHLRPGMTFVDVGAHYGYFTLLASRLVRPGGEVVAFEPSRHTGQLLRDNVGGLRNVTVEGCAVHERQGRLSLTDFGPFDSALNTVLSDARVPSSDRTGLRPSAYSVPTVSLDEYLTERGLAPDVVKLDAEGAELAILRGMRRTLRTARPIVVMETGDYDGMVAPSTSSSIDLLEASGYSCFEYHDGAFVPHERRSRYGYGNLFFLPWEGRDGHSRRGRDPQAGR